MEIKKMTAEDKTEVIAMMETFYASEAVLSNGSAEIFKNDVNACLDGNPYLEGYVFKENDEHAGYAMVAKSFSTEFGKPCIWIEDLYLKPPFRANGYGKQFFQLLFARYPQAAFRLEVEKENRIAVGVYKKCGFEELPYMEMLRNQPLL